MALVIEEFPPVAIALQREIFNHPKLMVQLGALPDDATLEERVAVILAYCGMVVDGWYSDAHVEVLFDHMLQKLRGMSTLIIH